MRCLHCLSWITALSRGSATTPPCPGLCALLVTANIVWTNQMPVKYHRPLDIWWLMQQISKYSHNAVVFQELLSMETQGHLRGDEWEG